jgi:hypothetical protein
MPVDMDWSGGRANSGKARWQRRKPIETATENGAVRFFIVEFLPEIRLVNIKNET